MVKFQVNFGEVSIPPSLDPPRPRVLPEFKRLAHGLRSGNISVLDAKTFYIPNLHYDGAGPDAYFWVGNGSEPNPFGTKVKESFISLKEEFYIFNYREINGSNIIYYNKLIIRTNQPRVSDYTITHLAQCDGELGVCPDSRLGGSNDAVVVSGSQKGGVTTITYRRPLAASEPIKDREILTTRAQSVIAAFGPLNARYEANAHSFMDTTRSDVQLDFGAQNDNNCIGLAELDAGGPEPWPPRVLVGVSNFTARIGPAGGKRGYTPITDNEISSGFLTYGHPSWGIAWYINDLLIPEIYVERGKSYIFLVEGGDDRTNPAKFHPFYISDSSEGGFGQKKEEDQRKQRVFAGVAYDNEGYPYPTTVGRYCEWIHKTTDQSATSKTFEDYMQTLQLECSDGEPAVLNWTVAHETPDLVYYQCYTHNNLGWKIHVVDPGTQINIPGDRSAIINLAPFSPPSYFTVTATLVILLAFTT
ncbi:jg14175 [Pararge aegeria aegeria]|uniref:Jg14175 protein n=1 Tax=Pararge aegeria aegeria TaxID=348720 RepID=A0A8S4SF24_9NEOP|nr:jg14175 [Pararge aegeria aegeria]CAH2261775.1 jg14175 [Pararge aegeria aegeria]